MMINMWCAACCCMTFLLFLIFMISLWLLRLLDVGGSGGGGSDVWLIQVLISQERMRTFKSILDGRHLHTTILACHVCVVQLFVGCNFMIAIQSINFLLLLGKVSNVDLIKKIIHQQQQPQEHTQERKIDKLQRIVTSRWAKEQQLYEKKDEHRKPIRTEYSYRRTFIYYVHIINVRTWKNEIKRKRRNYWNSIAVELWMMCGTLAGRITCKRREKAGVERVCHQITQSCSGWSARCQRGRWALSAGSWVRPRSPLASSAGCSSAPGRCFAVISKNNIEKITLIMVHTKTKNNTTEQRNY